MAGLKARAKTLNDLAENAAFYAAARPLTLTDKAANLLSAEAIAILGRLRARLEGVDDWSETSLEGQVRDFAEAEALKLGQVAQPLRAALTGSTTSPGIFEVMAVLGQGESLARLGDQTGSAAS